MTHSMAASDRLTRLGGPVPGSEGTRFGFFTDTSVCIGCKACEVACKEWNGVPEQDLPFTGNSYDNTGDLGANAWRHVAFVETEGGLYPPATPRETEGGLTPRETETARGAAGRVTPDQEPVTEVGLEWFGDTPVAQVRQEVPSADGFRWLMASDVCKHCTEPGCLEVCPTGAIVFTEFSSVLVQDDICNGCGYCVTACPFGVIERRESDGGAHKCTLCHDRMRGGMQPACSAACPTDSIQFGPLDELRAHAGERVRALQDAGAAKAQLYGHDDGDGVGGMGAFFLLLDDPEVYGLPPDPVTPTRDLGEMWKSAAVAALGLVAGVAAAFLGGGRR